MDRQQLLKKLDREWIAFKASYAGLSDAQLTTPGVVADWSVKDILAHVTTWEQEALKYLPVILAGEKTPRYAAMYGGIDAFNAQMTQQKRGLSLAEVQRQLDETHGRIIDYIHTVPEENFAQENRFRRRLRFDTYRHYAEHTHMILDWRQESGW
ncbi:MAG: DinB family protein [Anaerolineales bacterium]|jgi:hypothetical protein